MEGERLRPGLSQLLEQADFVSTSARFPQVIRLFSPSLATLTADQRSLHATLLHHHIALLL